MARCSLPLDVLSVAAAALRKREERAASEEREGQGANEARVFPGRAASGFFNCAKSTRSRRSPSDGSDRAGWLSAQAAARARPNSRPRPRLRPGRGGERGKRPRGRGPWAALPFSVDTGKARAQFRFFLFPGKLKIQIGSKEK